MKSSLDHAFEKRSANRSLAEITVQKAVGFNNWMPSGGAFQYGSFQQQAENRQRYALFTGWVHAAINTLAREAAGTPVSVATIKKKSDKPGKRKLLRMTKNMARKTAEQELEIALDHPLLNTLEHPNPMQTRWSFVYSFVCNISLTGWGYVIAGKGKNGLELYSVPTTWVKPDHSKGPFSAFKIVNPQKPESAEDSKPIPAKQVAFAQFPNPNDPFSAIAPAAAQSRSISIDDKIQSSQEAFFDQGIFPSVVVTVGTNPFGDGQTRPLLSPEQRRGVIAAIQKVSGGVANYGNPAIIDGLIEKIEKLSMSQNEMGWEKSEAVNRTRILSAFGVHPFLLGETIPGSYAQAYIIKDRFYEHVNCYLDMLSGMVTRLVNNINDEGDLVVFWDKLEAVDPGMENQKYQAARKNGDITQDELRAYMGLPPDEDTNQQVISKEMLTPLTGIIDKVGSGAIKVEQAVTILEGLGLPTDLAKKIIGKGPTKEELAARQQQQQQMMQGQQQPSGQQEESGKENAKPNAGGKPPKDKPSQDEEEDKTKKELDRLETILKQPLTIQTLFSDLEDPVPVNG